MKKMALSLLLVACCTALLLALSSCGEHKHVWADEPTVEREASCTETGSRSIRCLECFEVKEGSVEILPRLEHTWQSEATVDREPSCTRDGAKSIKCTVCKTVKSGTSESIAKVAHIFSEIKTVDIQPSCTAEGSKTTKCLSCGISDPTSAESIEKKAHAWGSEKTVDSEASCIADGSKTYKCTSCGASDTDSIEYFKGAHDLETSLYIRPTMTTTGSRTGVCKVCNETVTETLGKSRPTVKTLTSATSGTVVQKSNIAQAIRGDDHFYPTAENPDGKSLYLEYSFNYNPTLANMKDPSMGLIRLSDSGGSDADSPFYITFKDGASGMWCQYAGGIESGGGAKVLVGPQLNQNGAARENYPFIGEYGWHRIGIRVHQTAAIVGGAVDYTVTVELYIDGVQASVIELTDYKESNLLYTATIVDNKLVYADNPDPNRTLYNYRCDSGATNGSDVAYLVFADMIVSCGTGFVLDVSPVSDPADATLEVENGVEIGAKMFYKLKE